MWEMYILLVWERKIPVIESQKRHRNNTDFIIAKVWNSEKKFLNTNCLWSYLLLKVLNICVIASKYLVLCYKGIIGLKTLFYTWNFALVIKERHKEQFMGDGYLILVQSCYLKRYIIYAVIESVWATSLYALLQ